MTHQRLVLCGVGAKVEGLRWESDTRLRVGRSSSLEVVVTDASVSREHSEFVCTSKGWVLRDLGSRLGTFVNGRRLKEPEYLVRTGDLVQVGQASFQVTAAERAAAVSGRRTPRGTDPLLHRLLQPAGHHTPLVGPRRGAAVAQRGRPTLAHPMLPAAAARRAPPDPDDFARRVAAHPAPGGGHGPRRPARGHRPCRRRHRKAAAAQRRGQRRPGQRGQAFQRNPGRPLLPRRGVAAVLRRQSRRGSGESAKRGARHHGLDHLRPDALAAPAAGGPPPRPGAVAERRSPRTTSSWWTPSPVTSPSASRVPRCWSSSASCSCGRRRPSPRRWRCATNPRAITPSV